MKNTVITLALLLFATPVFSQELDFDIRGRYNRPVTKENLRNAASVSNVISGYPAQWITEYILVEIQATCNGKTMKSAGTNDILTAEQRAMVKAADMGTDILVNVAYKRSNPVTGVMEQNTMKSAVTVIPEIQAEYPGGRAQMTRFLRENGIAKISLPKDSQPVTVRFTINENGEITNAQVSKSSGDAATDNVLIEAIIAMPKWKPAQNANGATVKQDFEFNLGNSGC